MFIKNYDVVIESGYTIGFVRILGEYGVRFELSDEWNFVDPAEPDKRTWYRAFRIYATSKQMSLIRERAKGIL